MKTYRIDENWGKIIVTEFVDGSNARIAAIFTGEGYEKNISNAQEFVSRQKVKQQ